MAVCPGPPGQGGDLNTGLPKSQLRSALRSVRENLVIRTPARGAVVFVSCCCAKAPHIVAAIALRGQESESGPAGGSGLQKEVSPARAGGPPVPVARSRGCRQEAFLLRWGASP